MTRSVEIPDETTFTALRAFDGKQGYSKLERMRAALQAVLPGFVEIPEAAVEAACDLTYLGKRLTPSHARNVLAAALPYLAHVDPEGSTEQPRAVTAGAEDTRSEEERGFVEEALFAVDAGSAGHWPTVAGYLADEVRRLRAAPAGDGGLRDASADASEDPKLSHRTGGEPKLSNPDGLREALAKLADEYANELGTVSYQWLSQKTLKPLLAAHPAAPAVPQPAGQGPTQAEVLAAIDGERGYMDNWAGRARNDALSDARDAVEKLYEHASLTAVPQPVDREALAICLHSFDGYAIETGEQWSECNQDRKGAFLYQADAVLAVLTGEQEQVEK